MWAVLLLGAVGSILGAEDTFSSVNSMQDLVVTEARLIHFLKSVIEYENERLAQLIRYTYYFEEAHRPAALDPEAYVTNPLNAYQLMKRLIVDWQDIEDLIMKPVPMLSEVRQELDLPVKEDISGAADALCRLQDTYKLNTSELVEGKIRGVQYSQPMSANDAWNIGQQMYFISDYYHANIWFEAALALNEAEVDTFPLKPTNKSMILDYRAYSVYMLGNIRKALQLTEEYLEIMPNCTRNKSNREGYVHQLAEIKDVELPEDIEKHKPKHSYWNQEIQEKYEQLCRGEVKVNHALVCSYTDCGHPYFRLRRVKMEEVNLEPKIVVFHDVMYDSEIEAIKDLARPVISRSLVTNFTKGQLVQWRDRTRVSQTAFLEGNLHDVVAKVDKRAGMLANLDDRSSEQLQVLNYGIGGHYEPHYDFSESIEPDRGFPNFLGNRIATLLYYMSDVEQGGATVFPQLGAAVFPRKGTALLWYNLHRDGEGDYRTRHGACPVLIGDKWACNKWFHEGMQEFLRPCLLEQDSLPFKHMKDARPALNTIEASSPRPEHTTDNSVDSSEQATEGIQPTSVGSSEQEGVDDTRSAEYDSEEDNYNEVAPSGTWEDHLAGEDYEYSFEDEEDSRQCY